MADRRNSSAVISSQGGISTFSNAPNNQEGTGSGQCSPKGGDDHHRDESGMESDSLTYRGIYLPTLTNRFSDKKLETAYQRYACRQVGIVIEL